MFYHRVVKVDLHIYFLTTVEPQLTYMQIKKKDIVTVQLN